MLLVVPHTVCALVQLLQQDALQKGTDGVTSLEEIIRVCSGGVSE